MLQARRPLVVVVGPLRGQRGDRVVIGRQLDPQKVGVAGVQHPSAALSDRHPAVPERVAEERDEEDFGPEPEGYRPGLQPEPPSRRCWIRPPLRPVRELGRRVAGITARHAGAFLLGYVHVGVREVR